jgi:hypothetical protein
LVHHTGSNCEHLCDCYCCMNLRRTLST